MKIVHVPKPVLNKPVKSVPKIDRKIRTIIDNMIVTLEGETDPEGVGLAANQVGLSLAIFIMKPDEEAEVTVCINPIILKKKRKKTTENKFEGEKEGEKVPLEGCLSIPHTWGQVKRDDEVQLAYLDYNGKKVEKWFKGFEAIIVEHEMDHLNGVLFTQRVLEQGRELYKEVDGELETFEI